jgi:outer membrane protein OmpA-like peptidoglycan-associated protein
MSKIHNLLVGILCTSSIAITSAQVTDAVVSDSGLVTKNEIRIQNETLVNSPALEFSPAFYENGIVFISSQLPTKQKAFDDRIGLKTMSIFLSKRGQDGKLTAPTPFSEALVSQLHEGPIAFDISKANIFFTRNNNDGKNNAKYADGVARLKIYSSEKRGKTWSDAVELPINENISDACHPSINADGDKIYFSSNRLGGYGGMDLYVTEKNGGKWSKPVNMGPKVNTPKNEAFPFIHADGTLFFASDGLPGSGGYDIFFVKTGKAKMDLPTNIGQPFNSKLDDFGFIADLDLKNGYFTSNRDGGKGGDDIYSFNNEKGQFFDNLKNESVVSYDKDVDVTEGVRPITVLVYDRQTGKAIQDATVSYLNLDDLTMSEIIPDEGSGTGVQLIKSDGTFALEMIESKVKNKATDAIGKIVIKAPIGSKHVISAAKASYSSQQTIFKSNDKRTEVVLLLERPANCLTVKGKVVNKNNNGPIVNAIVTYTTDKSESQVVVTDAKGNFSYCVKCKDNYRVFATKDGVGSNIENVQTAQFDCSNGDKVVELVLKMEAPSSPSLTINDGAVFQLKNIYYNFDDADIRPEAEKDLNALFLLMKKFPSMEIELASHTDSRGSNAYNLELSQRRTANAKQYLVTKGIATERITAKGYGETMLRNSCHDGVPCSEDQHRNNRRTEFKVTKSGEANGMIIGEHFSPDTEPGSKK